MCGSDTGGPDSSSGSYHELLGPTIEDGMTYSWMTPAV